MDSSLLLTLNLAATGFMTGLIWFVQVVHYPLFADVHADAFRSYHAKHTTRTTWVVAGPMIVELLTSIGLVIYPAAGLPRALAMIGLGLVVLIWLSTAALQVPQHKRLRRGLAVDAHAFLCRSNWVRTIAWTARLVILLVAVARLG